MANPTDFRGDEYGFVAMVLAKGARRAFTSALHATREEAAREAFKARPTVSTVMTEARYPGKPCGFNIQWTHRRDLLAPLTAADHAARARSVPGFAS